MALKTTLAVLFSLNLLFFSSSSALPPAAPAPQPRPCPIDIRDLRVCQRTLVPFGWRGNIDQCCEVIRRVEGEAGVCICSAIKAGILFFNIRDNAEALTDLLQGCGVPSDLKCA